MRFGQLVIGSPGAGKSTYCDGMHQFMGAIGRKCSIVNLDPANDRTSYPCALDVRDLVTLDEIMEAEDLGPNGGILYALEELEHNFEWLEQGLKELEDDYILFDCPGQVELFTHHGSLRNMFLRLEKLGYRLVVVALTDSYVLTRPSLYISALLLALRSMLQLDLPHINVLTKIDNLSNYPELPFNLDFYTDVQDLRYLLPHLEPEQPGRDNKASRKKASRDGQGSEDEDEDEDEIDHPKSKFAALNRAIIQLVEDFALVGFTPLAIEDRSMMMVLLRQIDRAGGYAFGGEGANDTVWQIAMRENEITMDVRDVQERWIDRREEYDEEERKLWDEESKLMKEEGSAGTRTATSEEDGGIGLGGVGDNTSPGTNDLDIASEDDEDIVAIKEWERKRRKDVETGGIKIVRKG
ncbi:hypothetical protein BDY21DRAFT_362597 [Lineolata rhizophorae]|uniref:GPN-loop GTPase 2 n=1 Tax=Lineolata rhizophorae TaxID=578093 RepID=A0A6A6P6R1_9PEZI|nr:hypothetical protein BDY21DRAFT_362597 [Lineolata rhizophorae]